MNYYKDHQKINTHLIEKKWCSFHKTKTHNNSECNFLKNKLNKDNSTKSSYNNQNKSLVLLEPKTSNENLKIEIIVNSSIQFAILDTGSNFNLISENKLNELSIDTKNIDKSINVCGIYHDSIEINKNAEMIFELTDISNKKILMTSIF
ncbi:hypothetical protein DMUE_6136, partial [Dictyocoela muelleri]